MCLLDMGVLKGKHCILDTDDLVTEYVDEDTLLNIQKRGIEIKKVSKTNLSVDVSSHDNEYSLFIGGNSRSIYTGSFPKQCKRNDLFEYDIKIAEVGKFKGKIYIAVIANVWCKYDIEVPMFICQILSASIKDITRVSIACLTREPVYISTKSALKQQYAQCFGDFPERAIENKISNISITNKRLSILGVIYNDSHPIYDILDDKLCYFTI